MPIKQKQIKKKTKPEIKKTYIYIAASILTIIVLFYLMIKISDKESHEKRIEKGFDKTQSKDIRSKVTDSVVPVDKARLELISSGGRDIIKVLVDKKDPEVVYRYQWTINGNILKGHAMDNISDFKEGDTVGVLITPTKGDKEGQPRYLSLVINTVTPKVLGISEPNLENDLMTFRIVTEAKDDALSFSMIEAPKGMVIDGKKGEIRWPIKDVPAGQYEGKVTVKNKKGAETLYTFKINLGELKK